MDSILPGSGFNLIVSSSRLLQLSLTDLGHIGHNHTLEQEQAIHLRTLELIQLMLMAPLIAYPPFETHKSQSLLSSSCIAAGLLSEKS